MIPRHSGRKCLGLKGKRSIRYQVTVRANWSSHRFKVAARQNSNRWYNASVKLFPSPSGAVQIYDQALHQFMDHPESTPTVELKGPFCYFLSTVNVDRLEPEFRIMPLARTLPSSGATCDIVIIRPIRDPSVDADDKEARDKYVDKIWKVMGGAYMDGIHVGLKYDERGQIVDEGDGPPVVEYIRCGGWEWTPVRLSLVDLFVGMIHNSIFTGW